MRGKITKEESANLYRFLETLRKERHYKIAGKFLVLVVSEHYISVDVNAVYTLGKVRGGGVLSGWFAGFDKE